MSRRFLLTMCIPLYGAAECKTVRFEPLHYNTIQSNTIQYNTIQYNTIQYNTIHHYTIQYKSAQLSCSQITKQNIEVLVHVCVRTRHIYQTGASQEAILINQKILE